MWEYLAEVTSALGVGLESCTVDHDSPVSAYVALDGEFPAHPGRDTALLWNELHGWAAAVETHSGEDLIIVRYLGGNTIAPPAAQVARFVNALRENGDPDARHTPPLPRPPDLTARRPLASRKDIGPAS
ncbi:hypothetical protein C791_1295 [Amycolatopsis azurea DSM 43854]|uniref:DUF6292 domain-containing protein n=1 Tax=Amycolatopsis azurea DSM 43854 TaxID=1238180 RepID=M2QNN7_9PSEU|nr:hypothetical protein C791_1295 [Amycolatopsis azurea DSM 43854]